MVPGKRNRDSDTIAAIATAAGIAGIGVVRVSGPDAIAVAQKIFQGERDLNDMKGYEAAHGWACLGDEKLDEVVLLLMRSPKSYTCEDMVEISCHGGPLVLRRVLEAALGSGARMAEPGEFTKRAFLAGRIDLSQAESIAALINSRTEAGIRAALRGLSGELKEKIALLREGLVQTLSDLEAGLDFAEEDIEFITRDKLQDNLQALLWDLDKLIKRADSGKILAEGVKVVIAGSPNVGKSTLMNALLERDRVIVTPHPGTTRDVVEETINLGGVPVQISDTAGIRDAKDEIEQQGVERTRTALSGADLVLLMLDGSRPLADLDRKIIQETAGMARMVLVNKIDLPQKLNQSELQPGACLVSAKTGEGVPELKTKIQESIWSGKVSGEDALIASLRQKELLDQCRTELEQAMATAKKGLSEEFIAAGIRRAIDLISELSGQNLSEEILEKIFSNFCIGK